MSPKQTYLLLALALFIGAFSEFISAMQRRYLPAESAAPAYKHTGSAYANGEQTRRWVYPASIPNEFRLENKPEFASVQAMANQ